MQSQRHSNEQTLNALKLSIKKLANAKPYSLITELICFFYPLPPFH